MGHQVDRMIRVYNTLFHPIKKENDYDLSVQDMENLAWTVTDKTLAEDKITFLFERPAIIGKVLILDLELRRFLNRIDKIVYREYGQASLKCPYCQAAKESLRDRWLHSYDCPWKKLRNIQKNLRKIIEDENIDY